MIIKEVTAVAAAVVILAAILCGCGSDPVPAQVSAEPDAASASMLSAPASASVNASAKAVKVLKDGIYEYIGKNDLEGYHVEGTMVISNGAVQSMEWKIIDNTGRVFDETYEEVYTGNDLYIQQCRDNWSGIQTFVPALLDTQDPTQVDAVSGATWAYKKFEEAAKALIEQAKQ